MGVGYLKRFILCFGNSLFAFAFKNLRVRPRARVSLREREWRVFGMFATTAKLFHIFFNVPIFV